MKNNKTRKLLGGREERKYKTKTIQLNLVNKDGYPVNIVDLNPNVIDKENLGVQVLHILKQIRHALPGAQGSSGAKNDIIFSIVGKKMIA